MIHIPVYLIDRGGIVGTDFINCNPCVKVVVSDPSSGQSREVYGLLDTGADGIWVDHDLIAQIEAESSGQEMSYGATGSHLTGVYSGNFQLEGAPVLNSRYLAGPLRAVGRKYDVVLGRSVISKFLLGIDGPNGEVQLILR